jgi:TolB protein
LLIPALVRAQFRVEVSGVGANKIPIAIATLKGEGALNRSISALVMSDLARSGQFEGVVESESALDEIARVDTSPWRRQGRDALVCGSVKRLPDGRLQLGVRIWDTVNNKDLGGQSLTAQMADARLAAHRIADFVYVTLTGVRGIFSTRIAYVTKASGKYDIQVADADGFGRQSALSSTEPIISPTWSPDGKRIAYVSFESRKPVVYVHELKTGKRRLVANFKGSNSAPGWAPDGNTLAVTLTHEGESQIYLLDLVGATPPMRVMQSESIDTEAKFSADAKTLYFVSDRGGSPQIYKVSVDEGLVERVTFDGSYNISPSVSSDGRWMAYVSRIKGEFKLRVMDLASGVSNTITDTVADESPCFAPNSRMIMYATQINGDEALMTSNMDGTIKTRLAGSFGNIREPAWGPFEEFAS